MTSAIHRFVGACGIAAILAAPGASAQDKAETKPAEPPAAKSTVPLIPREILFGNPTRSQGRISPDGKQLAFLAPVNGVLNVWVGPATDLAKAKPVTSDDKRGVRQYSWAYTGKHIIFRQDKGGDENWRIFAVDLASGQTKDLTPMEGVAAQIVDVNEKFPQRIIVGLNDRNPQWHDLHAIDIVTGEKALIFENNQFASFTFDNEQRVRMAMQLTPDGGAAYHKAKNPDKLSEGFEPDFTVGPEDVEETHPIGFDASGKTMYLTDSRGRDTAALFAKDMATGEAKVILRDDKSDISDVMINPVDKTIDAAQTNYDRENWALVNRALEPDFMAMRMSGGMGDMNVTSRSLDDRVWTVVFVNDDGPAKTWLVDRGDLKNPKRKPALTLLFANKPELADQPLVKINPVEIKTRDDLTMVCYLALPCDADPKGTGRPTHPVPLVLMVHGGPWARDHWGFDPNAQWLANRGYGVLNVNFRGSTGFGKKFLNAGNKEWAGKMHDDLIDAVNWAVDKKIADKSKVAIMGGSYGGYATLVGLTFTPDVFACGVDIVGPSNINTLIASVPPYWKPMLDMLHTRVGDSTTEAGRKFLDERSPLGRADKITKPLLIGQGANDPRVKRAEADQIVKAMRDKNIPVMYVLYPDEGHGLARPENRMSFNAVAEAFLAQHLGGRVEPIGDACKGSSITVPVGGEQIPGLTEALSAAQPAKK